MAIGRCALLLREEKAPVDLRLIRNHPDHAGLIGAAHLLPAWMLKGHDAILAVDIGGANIRAGVVRLNSKMSPSLAKATVARLEHWRHAEEKTTRDNIVGRLVKMLVNLGSWPKKKDVRLAPVVGIGCLGTIRSDGTIRRGAENLPGNW